MQKAASLLFRLTHPAAPGPSYLFGTMHVRDARAFGQLERVHAALDECAAFAAEFDLHEADAAADPEALYLPDGQTLHDYLNPNQYQRLQRILARAFGLPLDHYVRLRPMLIANLIGERILAHQHGDSLDAHLHERAITAKKMIYGLESYAEQQALLERLSIESQLKSLIAIGRNPARFRKQTQTLADRYAAGELRGLYQNTRRGTGALRTALIFERNRRMADRFHEVALKQTLFAAVGAAHLPGGKGVLRLLKHAGWRVRAV